MEKPFAITLDPGSSRADKTGSWRTERAVYTSRLAPCGNSCPAGEDVRSWLNEAERAARGTNAPGARSWDQPVPGGDGTGLLPPV